MLRPRDRVLLAVSGGPDSVCLLYSLHLLRRLFRIELEVFHFDHGLRADSEGDATYVLRLAQRLHLPFHLRRAEGQPARGRSVEDWAHRVRSAAILEVHRERRTSRVARAHTMDDQAETVLLALLRGGGLEAVSGMPPVAGPSIRPLIDVTREETRRFCRALGLRPRRDPTNLETNLMRNALRLEGIPALERAIGRNIAEPVVRTAALLRVDADYVRSTRSEHASEPLQDADGSIRLDARAIRDLHRALSSRIVREAMLRELGEMPEQKHVDAVLDLARGRSGRRADLPGGLIARRTRDYVVLSRSSPGN